MNAWYYCWYLSNYHFNKKRSPFKTLSIRIPQLNKEKKCENGKRPTFECPNNCGSTLRNKDSLIAHLKKICTKI